MIHIRRLIAKSYNRLCVDGQFVDGVMNYIRHYYNDHDDGDEAVQ